MEKLRVELGVRAYDILIGPGLLAQTGALMAGLDPSGRVAVVSDENVAELHLESLRAGLASSGIEMESLVLPA